MSLAGQLKQKNLIMRFDNNSISIDGPTSLAVSDQYKKGLKAITGIILRLTVTRKKKFLMLLKKFKGLRNQQ